jgi:hypothetical protein
MHLPTRRIDCHEAAAVAHHGERRRVGPEKAVMSEYMRR